MNKWWLLGGCMLFGGYSLAQEDSYVKEKAQIREIKLSGNYYYSDVSTDTEEDAKAMVRQLIVLRIQEEEPGNKRAGAIVEDSCRYIQLKRLDKIRIFGYLSKESYAQASDTTRKKGAQTGSAEVKKGPVVVADSGREKAGKMRQDSVKTVVTVGDSAKIVNKPVKESVSDSAKRVVKKTVTASVVAVKKDSIHLDTAKKTPVTPAKIVAADTVKVVVKDTVKLTVKDTVKVVVRDTVKVVLKDRMREKVVTHTTGKDRLDKILTFKTISEVETYFIARKREGKMMFGKMKSVTRPESCYLLIFDRNGKVLSVLDKGGEYRKNLTTGKEKDRPENYKGQGIVWFVLY